MEKLTADTLVGLLDGPRARGAFLLRSILSPPWSMRIEDGAPVSVVTMLSGDAWVVLDGEEPVLLQPGEIAILRGPDPYTIADDPSSPPDVVIGPDQVCTTLRGSAPSGDAMNLGVRTWGEDPDGSHVMISGTYQMSGEIGKRLLRALPPLLVRPAEGPGSGGFVALLASEIARDAPGQELVLDRILDLLLVDVLRTWLASPGSGAPGWYRAQHDEVVGPVLRLLHSEPAHPWTVASLASEAGVSRAALARRFTSLVGETPMNYLTGWRLAMAADLLHDSDATVESIARQVGYGSPFALSTAFKRERGVSPQEHRRRVRKKA